MLGVVSNGTDIAKNNKATLSIYSNAVYAAIGPRAKIKTGSARKKISKEKTEKKVEKDKNGS